MNKNTKASALALKDLLGTIELDPVPGEFVVGNERLIEVKPYYIATTNIQTLALLDQEYRGSNWLQCRETWDGLRTFEWREFSRFLGVMEVFAA